MDPAQSFYTVYLFKLVILGGLVALWVAWLAYKIVSVIDRNVALTEPEPKWRDWIKYRINLRRHPDVLWEEVDRPRFRIGFWQYSVLMLLIIALMYRCW